MRLTEDKRANPRSLRLRTGGNTAYWTWHQTAGYFDGDGSVTLSPEMYTVSLGLDWVDSYRPQLEVVRRFLIDEELKPMQIYSMGGRKPVWHLRLSKRVDLLRASSKLAPLLVKKKDQVEATIRYLKDEITGEELVEEFNDAIRRGSRSGYIRILRMPYTHRQGVAKAQENNGKGPLAAKKISPSVLDEVKNRKTNWMTLKEISDSANVSVSSIRRALARDRSSQV